MVNRSESGRSMVEMLVVIGIIVLLTIGGLYMYHELHTRMQVKSVSERLISLRDQRRLNGVKYSGEHVFEDNEGPFGTVFIVKNGLGDQNKDYFWITVRKNSAAFCEAMQKADVGAKSIDTKNCPEEVTFYFLKNPEDTSVTGTPDKDHQPTISCPTGRIVGGECKSCISHATCQDGDVICNSGYYFISVECKTCQEIDPHAAACNANGTSKECKSGYYLKGTVCKDCPEHATCNGGQYSFNCESGYYKSGDSCLPCGTGVDECSDSTHATSCKTGYFLKNNQCKTCQEINPHATSCDNNGVTSSCQTGYYLKNNVCATCIENATCTNGTTFVCVNGKYKSGNTCKDCPDNATCQNNVITCNSGFRLENETCVLSCTQDGECAGCKQIDATLPNWNSAKGKCVCSVSPNSCGTSTCNTTTGECGCNPEADTCEEGLYCKAETNTCIENPCTIANSTPNPIANKQISGTQCYCKNGFIIDNVGTGCRKETSCTPDPVANTCKKGYYCNSVTKKCAVNICTMENATPNPVENNQISGTECYCKFGYIVNKEGTGCIAEQTCTPKTDNCTAGYYCNPNTNKCIVNTCTIENSTPNIVENNQISGTECYCKFGYIVNKEGTGCIAEQTCTPKTDNCTVGYYCNPNTNKCIVNTCTIANSTPNLVENNQISGTECYCKTGYFVDNNTCFICPTLNNPEITNNSTTCQTKCTNTLAIDNGNGTYTCTYCPTDKQCGTQCCGNGQTCNTKTKMCECSTDKPYYDEIKKSCVACRNFDDCGSDPTKICNTEGICETCENGQEANDTGNQCICRNGNWTGSNCECNVGYSKYWEFSERRNSKGIQNSCCALLMKSYYPFACSLHSASFNYCTTSCARYGGNPPKGYFCSFEHAYADWGSETCMPTDPLIPEFDDEAWWSQSIMDYYPAAFYQRISEFHPQKIWVKGVGTLVTHDPMVHESQRFFCSAVGALNVDFNGTMFPHSYEESQKSWNTTSSEYAKKIYNAVGSIYLYGNYGNNTFTNGVMKMDVYQLMNGYTRLTSITTADRVYRVCFLGTDDSWLNCPKNASGNGNGNLTNKKDCYCNDAYPKWNGTECIAQ